MSTVMIIKRAGDISGVDYCMLDNLCVILSITVNGPFSLLLVIFSSDSHMSPDTGTSRTLH